MGLSAAYVPLGLYWEIHHLQFAIQFIPQITSDANDDLSWYYYNKTSASDKEKTAWIAKHFLMSVHFNVLDFVSFH